MLFLKSGVYGLRFFYLGWLLQNKNLIKYAKDLIEISGHSHSDFRDAINDYKKWKCSSTWCIK